MSEFVLQLPGADTAIRRPSVAVAVVMRRERIDNRWQPWRWSLADIVPHEEGFGKQPRLLLKDEQEERWLHPGFKVELFTDDAEGYYLNVTTPQPCFWVVWRMEEEAAQAFVDAHYVLEAKRRQRPQSFKPLQDRFGNPARVSTDKKFGGGGHG